jgi:hypothetical protein
MVGIFEAKNYADKGLQWSISVQITRNSILDKIRA